MQSPAGSTFYFSTFLPGVQLHQPWWQLHKGWSKQKCHYKLHPRLKAFHWTKEWWTYHQVSLHLMEINLGAPTWKGHWQKIITCGLHHLKCFPWFFLQLNPCVPKQSIFAPQWLQECGWHRGAPRRRPIAILTVSSFIRRPREDISMVLNHAPESRVDTPPRDELWS